MKALRIAIVLAFGVVLQIGRLAFLKWRFPEGAPEWVDWTSGIVWLVLWLSLGNLLNWGLERMMSGDRPKR